MIKKIAIIFLIIIFVGSMTCTTMATSLAEQKKEIEKQILESEEKLEEIENNLSDTMKEIQNLTTSINSYESEISDLNKNLNTLEEEIEDAEEELEELEENHAKQLDLFQTRLVAMAEAGETTYLDVLLNSADFTDLISNYYLVTEMANLDVEIMEKIEEETKTIEKTKETLSEKKQEVIEAKAEVEKKATALKNTKTQKDNYVTKLNAEEAVLQEKIDEYNEEANKIEAAIKKANSGSNSNYNKYTGGTLAWPTRITKRVNSIYAPGGRTDIPVSGTTHRGIDLYAPQGTPIYAAADGEVVYINASGWGGGYGTYVVLSHGNGLYTLYAHGSGVGNISVGSNVTTDTVIMYSGSTGWSYGAHLHFEVCLGGTSNKVNPAPYLGIENKVGNYN